MLLLMTNHAENDLRNEDKELGFTNLGEIDRSCKFNIDFEKIDWIQDLTMLEDDDPRWGLEKQIQRVSMEMIKLYEMLEKDFK